jgi:hypothetical protein
MMSCYSVGKLLVLQHLTLQSEIHIGIQILSSPEMNRIGGVMVVRFVLDQQSVDRHVTPPGHIILILSQPVFALSPKYCVLGGEATNTNFRVFGTFCI